MIRRQRIPNDNSCLFTAIDFLNNNGVFCEDAATKLRTACIEVIKENKDNVYDALRLGQEPDEYCDWLSLWSSWGS